MGPLMVIGCFIGILLFMHIRCLMYGIKVFGTMEFGRVVLSFRVAIVFFFLSMVLGDGYCRCTEFDYLGFLAFYRCKLH